MEALFIGQTYIDVTLIADDMPKGDEKAVAKDYAVSFGGNALTAAFACAKLGHVPDLLTSLADDWLGRMFLDMAAKYQIPIHARKVKRSSLSFILPREGKRAILRAREQRYPEPFTSHSSRMRYAQCGPEKTREREPRRLALRSRACRCARRRYEHRLPSGDHGARGWLSPAGGEGPGRGGSRQRASSHVMTSAGALVHGIRKLGARKISLMAPYMRQLTDKVFAHIESEGIEVVDRLCFEFPGITKHA
jgi:hypothetical protein